MVISVLGMEENVNSINDIRKFVKRTKIQQVNIPHKNNFLIDNDEIEFFKSLDVMEQLQKIKEMKNEIDICLVSSWSTARLAYMADLAYIIYFVGNDIRIPPFVKHSRPEYFEQPVTNLSFLQRRFYKNVFENAVTCVAAGDESFTKLKKFRDDGVRIDRTIVNTKMFNPEVIPKNIKKDKFVFFCPQRIGIEKGTDILWKAIPLCKSDFEVLQVEWFDDTSEEASIRSHKLLDIKPDNVKLIPKIPRKQIASYIVASDAVLGEMRLGLLNNIERESAACKKPVICYYDQKYEYLIDGIRVKTPFKPNSNSPEVIADLIDQVISSNAFRDKLALSEYEFVSEYANPDKAGEEWDKIIEKSLKLFRKNNSSNLRSFLRTMFYKISHKMFAKKNIALP